MKKLHLLLAVLCGVTSLQAAEPATSTAPTAPAPAVKKPTPIPQPPDIAAPKLMPDGQPNAGFMSAHEKFVAIAKEGKTDLLFLGDSITAGWGGQKAIWDKAFGAYNPANFGIGGDRTQHVLWRITNGELDGIKPKVAVIMIGTNNTGGDTPEGIASGITKIVETIRQKTPTTKILLLAIFPRGEKASPNPGRDKINKVNPIIAKLDDGKHVFYLDIGGKFLEPDGSMTKENTKDFLHFNALGYQIWADAISPKLAELMK